MGEEAVRVGGADQPPHSLVRVVTDQQNRLAAFENLKGLDAGGAASQLNWRVLRPEWRAGGEFSDEVASR